MAETRPFLLLLFGSGNEAMRKSNIVPSHITTSGQGATQGALEALYTSQCLATMQMHSKLVEGA